MSEEKTAEATGEEKEAETPKPKVIKTFATPKPSKEKFLCKFGADGGAQLVREDGSSFQVTKKQLKDNYDLTEKEI